MLKFKGLSDVSVTATPQVVDLPDQFAPYVLRNTGAKSVFVLYDPDGIPRSSVASFAGANRAAIKALGGREIRSGWQVTVPATVPWLMVVSATDETTTLVVDPGQEEHADL